MGPSWIVGWFLDRTLNKLLQLFRFSETWSTIRIETGPRQDLPDFKPISFTT